MSKSISDEIDEILRTKIEIQFPESLAPNPVVIYGEAFEALTALFNEHVEKLLPKDNTSMSNYMTASLDEIAGYQKALDDIKAKLKGE